MEPLEEHGDEYCGTLIAGGSYAFESSIILSLEYLYNSRGYSDQEAEGYYALRTNAANAYHSRPYAGLSRQTLGMAANNGLKYLRQNYLIMQISRSNIKDVLDLRYLLTYNMDDNSSMSILNMTHHFNDHTEFYLHGISCNGNDNTEYSSIIDRKLTIGYKYTF